jgi:hypothetical protein
MQHRVNLAPTALPFREGVDDKLFENLQIDVTKLVACCSKGETLGQGALPTWRRLQEPAL